MGCMVLLRQTNKTACGVKLHPMTVLHVQSCPDMYTVAVFVLYRGLSDSFSLPVDGLTRLQLSTHPLYD